jgi:hypothetical protein
MKAAVCHCGQPRPAPEEALLEAVGVQHSDGLALALVNCLRCCTTYSIELGPSPEWVFEDELTHMETA